MHYLSICLLGLVLQIAFILTERQKNYVSAVVLKGSASLVFILVGFLSLRLAENGAFARLVLAGLILGGVGDVLLNLRFVFPKAGQVIFLAGVAAFLAGHILYLAALIPLFRCLVWSIVCGVLLAALLLWRIFSRVGGVKLSFKIFGVVYIGAVSLMTAVAGGNLLASPGSVSALLYFLGALLFTGSDVILILNTFGGEPRFSLRAANLSLYYIGQLLIAVCLQFI